MEEKYWITTVKVTVVSKGVPPEFDTLSDLQREITSGNSAGDFDTESVEVSKVEALDQLERMGVDPDYLEGMDG